MKYGISFLLFMIASVSFAQQPIIVEDVLEANMGRHEGSGCWLEIKYNEEYPYQPYDLTYLDEYQFVGSLFPNSTWNHNEDESYFEVRDKSNSVEGALRVNYNPIDLGIVSTEIVSEDGGCIFENRP